ncbi:NAD(P)/FAD-dependent oxidoreductase [Parablautia intestinalis]|jgi:predicted Rossmann fold flavoprotein|uniref:NAD(P)/FAD-dependent oxidoreductase n=1 Tax=Parablautia intestinalis TaxID=2320100 RepID=UPI0023CE5DB6|nr:NAD(P)/FAD-dependent oxidoreductase [Parablautia intestinalis]MCI8613780.1 NAD(P)/FAD-dependent oxidoreductase [Lachnospiraceae bacterium]MDE7048189.1 NAD(P)/FAD-dependent oxidoreductase [Lachnospiraceae bacterium]
MKHVIVVGGGAAGMMAAVGAAGEGARVTLLEQNEKTGKKIFITGKGRCNLTNACEKDAFFEHVVSNGKFLYSAFSKLDNFSTMSFFEKAGCRLKKERGERIFPSSDHAYDVTDALNRRMEKEGVRICLHTCVAEILTKTGMAKDDAAPFGEETAQKTHQKEKSEEKTENEKERIMGVRLTDGRILRGDAVILATGGKSYESTGSSGDGYRFARQMGHSVKDIKPALVPFTVQESWCMQMQGLSLKNVAVLLKSGKKRIFEGFGEMLFTHFGVSGPLILSASSYYVKKYFGMPVELCLDLKPALSREQLDGRLLRDFEENKNRQFKNVLEGLLPAKMIPVIVELSGITPEKRVNEITRQERNILIECLKNLTMTVTGTRGFEEAIITQGGVYVKEINPSTMESKLVKDLYFAGEVLDLDAMTGGFNLQIAWSTGYLAGISAAGSGS